MGIELKMNTPEKIFHQGLPSTDARLPVLTGHLAAGNLKINLGMYSVILGFPKHKDSDSVGVNLKVSTTAVLKGNVQADIAATVANDLRSLLDAAFEFLETNPVAKSPLAKALESLEAVSEAVSEPKKSKAPMFKKSEPMPAGGPVKLAEAQVVGQPVRGTSQGSTYYAIALSGSVKLAARIKSDGGISLRAEGEMSPAERKYLKQAGMKDSGQDYLSIHFDAQGVPPARIIGAFLLGLGLDFEAQVTNGNQLKVEG